MHNRPAHSVGERARMAWPTRASRLIPRLAAAGLLTTGLAFAAPSLALAAPSASQETLDQLSDAQSRYDAAQDQLSQIGQELEELSYQQSETQANIDDLTGKISSKQGEIDSKQAEVDAKAKDIESKQAEVDAKQAEIEATQRQIEQKQDKLAERVSTSYKAGGVSILSVVLNSDSMESLLSNVRYMQSISDSEAAQIGEVKDLKQQEESQKAELESQRSALEDEKSALEADRAELQGQQRDLESQRADQQNLKDQLQTQSAATQAKQDEAQRLLDSLDQEVRDLMEKKAQEEEAARQEEIRKAQEAAAAAARANASAAGAAGVPAVVGDGLRGQLVASALSLLGKPYVWGGTYPASGGTDCSGLMQYAFAQCGYSIPRTTYTQLPACRAAGHVFYDTSQLQPGDLVFCNGGHHVVMYIGNGNVVHAPHPGDVVRVAPLSQFSIVAMGFPIA